MGLNFQDTPLTYFTGILPQSLKMQEILCLHKGWLETSPSALGFYLTASFYLSLMFL